MTDYIAYYRVSTDRQGQSGYGLADQRRAVARFTEGGYLVAEYEEIESGKRHTNRPKLTAALADCKKRRAVLVIAKLDRLSRNLAFIANLMEAGVDFIACDNPHANRTMLQMLAVFAEHERSEISRRTKAALAEAKRQGKTLGNPRLAEARERARQAHRKRSQLSPELAALLVEYRSRGMGLRAIARALNVRNVRTPRGFHWYADTVKAQLAAVSP